MKRLSRCCAPILIGLTMGAPAPGPTRAVAAPGSVSETLAVTFVTPSLGWRVGDRWNPGTGGRGPVTVNRSTDGGVHWQPISTVTGVATGNGQSFNLYAASLLFADPRDGWLYGNRLYATHDGGRRWRRLPLRGTETELSSVGHNVWRLDQSCDAANTCRLTLLTSAAGSDAWRVLNRRLPNAPPPPNALTRGATLARADQSHAWLVSGPYTVRNHMLLRLLATSDGGRTWHGLPMPCSRNGAGSLAAQLVPYTARNLWLFCASEPGAGEQAKSVFRSSDGGRSWSMVASSGGFGNDGQALYNLTIAGYLDNAAVSAPSVAWIALVRDTLIQTDDGGRTWFAAIPLAIANPGDGGLGPVQFVDAGHGWLFSAPDLLFRTVDGGRCWRTIRMR